MTTNHLPKKWYIARINYLNQIIEKLPTVKVGTHKGVEVLWLRTNGKRTEIHQKHKDFQKLKETAIKRQLIEEELATLKADWKRYFKESLPNELARHKVTMNDCYFMTHGTFMKLIDQECPEPKTTNYQVNGRSYRSRLEMRVSEAAKDLRLHFKYDCGLRLNSETNYYLDFAFDFEEFNRFLAMEVFGMMDNENYQIKSATKLRNYMASGLYLDRDIFVICADSKYIPNQDQIKQALIHMVDTLCEKYVTEI